MKRNSTSLAMLSDDVQFVFADTRTNHNPRPSSVSPLWRSLWWRWFDGTDIESLQSLLHANLWKYSSACICLETVDVLFCVDSSSNRGDWSFVRPALFSTITRLSWSIFSGTSQLRYQFRYWHKMPFVYLSAVYMSSVYLSSVTRMYSDKMAEAKIMQFSLKCSPMP